MNWLAVKELNSPLKTCLLVACMLLTTMKVYLATLLTVLGIPVTTYAFLTPPPPRSICTSSSLLKSTTSSSLDEEFETAFNDGDDFYSDYDPSKYESSNYNDDENGGSSSYGYDDRPVRRGRGGGGRGGRGGRGGGRGRGRGGGGSRKPKEYLGPNGHDYELSSDSGPNNSKFDESAIHALLAERLQAKFARDFHTADSIQMELIDGGVFVHDGMKEWRADGIPYGSFNGGGSGPKNARNIERQVYTKSKYSSDVMIDNVVNNDLITKLVKERTKFKMMREYSKADAVREGLRTKFRSRVLLRVVSS
jgi:hypothetical protein